MNTFSYTTLLPTALVLLVSCNSGGPTTPRSGTAASLMNDSTEGVQDNAGASHSGPRFVYGPGNDPAGILLAAGPDTLVLTDADRRLIARLKTADIPTIKAYIRSVLDEDMPKDFVLPGIMKTSGSAQEAELVFQVRYPEFYGKQGEEYLRAAADSPIRFRQLIRETRSVRQFYQKSNN